MGRRGKTKKKKSSHGDSQHTNPTDPGPSSADAADAADEFSNNSTSDSALGSTGAESGSSSISARASIATSGVSTRLSSVFEIDRFKINCTFVEINGRLTINPVVSPEPKNLQEYRVLTDGLAIRIVHAELNVASILKNLQEEKDKYSQLEDKYSQLEDKYSQLKESYFQALQERDMLKTQLDSLQTKVTILEKRLQDVTDELHATKLATQDVTDELNATKFELNATKLATEVGSWVEFARRILIEEYKEKGVVKLQPGEIVDEINQARLWRIVTAYVKKNNENETEFYESVKKNFGIDKEDWKVVAIQFMKNVRNAVAHPCSPLDVVIKLLDFLPPEYEKKKPAFLTLIKKASMFDTSEHQENVI